jgi:transcriptional regulator with XRE-family HTH domain
MRLEDWMTATKATDQALATKLGVDRSTISRIRRGKRVPSVEIMRAIHEATSGAVSANDFVHANGGAE